MFCYDHMWWGMQVLVGAGGWLCIVLIASVWGSVTLVTLVDSLSLDWSCLSMTAGLPLEVTAWCAWLPPGAECYSIQRPLSQSSLHLLADLALFSATCLSGPWRCQLWHPSGSLWNLVYSWTASVPFWLDSCIFVFFLLVTAVFHLPCLVFLGILSFYLFLF